MFKMENDGVFEHTFKFDRDTLYDISKRVEDERLEKEREEAELQNKIINDKIDKYERKFYSYVRQRMMENAEKGIFDVDIKFIDFVAETEENIEYIVYKDIMASITQELRKNNFKVKRDKNGFYKGMNVPEYNISWRKRCYQNMEE